MTNVIELVGAGHEPASPLDLELRINVLKERLQECPEAEHGEILREILRLRGQIREQLGVRTALAPRSAS